MKDYSPPKNWGKLSLGELTKGTRPICYGVLKPGDFVEDGVPLIRVTDISDNRFDDTNLIRISASLDDEFRRSRLNGGELLLSIQGTVGRVAICPHEYAGANISRTIAVIEPDSRADRQYAYWFLRFLGAGDGFHTVGTTRSSLNIEALRKVEIPLPPLNKQRLIADILDRAEALRANRRAALTKLDTLTQAIFSHLFGDLRNQELVSLESLAAEKRHALSSGPFGSSLTSEDYVDEGVLVLRGLNVTGGEINLSESKFVSETKARELSRSSISPGDIVIVAVGASGFACLIPDLFPPAVLSQNFNKVSPNLDIVNGTYLCHVLNSSFVQRQFSQNITDTVRTFLSLTKLKTIAVPLPPLPLQQEFTRRVSSVEQLRAAHRDSLAKLDELFASLQHRAFRGEL